MGNESPPPPIISEVRVYSECQGYGRTCIIDLAGSRFPLFDIRTGSIFEAYNLRIINAGHDGRGRRGADQRPAARHI